MSRGSWAAEQPHAATGHVRIRPVRVVIAHCCRPIFGVHQAKSLRGCGTSCRGHTGIWNGGWPHTPSMGRSNARCAQLNAALAAPQRRAPRQTPAPSAWQCAPQRPRASTTTTGSGCRPQRFLGCAARSASLGSCCSPARTKRLFVNQSRQEPNCALQ